MNQRPLHTMTTEELIAELALTDPRAAAEYQKITKGETDAEFTKRISSELHAIVNEFSSTPARKGLLSKLFRR
ncbi:hypothetical protein [Nocardia pseudovaccinii]|uniref:hypothetical protein n=1 Tax=Nocardia pseudovaccinii TaxID=189540 RepID=UPI0007A4DFC3|nr:hypothetical protein [Nocardia pseudovaccinii]